MRSGIKRAASEFDRATIHRKGLRGGRASWCFPCSDEHRHDSFRCVMLIVPGRAALSVAKQARMLARGRAVCPGLRGLTASWIHLVMTQRPLSATEAAQLDKLLA